MRQVEVQRADRHIAVGDRFEVGRMARRFDHRPEPEPVIIVAARIGALDDPQAAIIAQALAADADALDLVGRHRREIDVDQRPRLGLELEQRREHPLGPGFGGGERHGVAHALARIGLAERDRADAGERAFHRRRNGARISDVLGEIGAAVDPRQDHVGRRILHDVGEREHHRVGRRAGDREAALVMAPQAHRRRSGSANGRRPIAPRSGRRSRCRR